jgi:signal peptide peptidase SppA
MADYIRILTKIQETPWMITPESLQVILDIVDRRVNGENLTDEQIEDLLTQAQLKNNGRSSMNSPFEATDDNERTYQIVNGLGILPLNGPIFGKANLMTQLSGATSLETFQSDFRSMMKDDMIHSILLDIDSPGGSSDMVQEVAQEIRDSRADKPIYAIADTLAGSAAYYLGSQATSLYSTPSGSVGSIGVLTVHKDQSGADAQSGHKYTFVHAAPYKTEGNPHEPLTEEGRQYRQEVVDDLYEEFVQDVAAGRNTTVDKVRADYGGGRVLFAKKALDAGMVDGVLPYEQLVSQLTSQPRQVQVSIPVSTIQQLASNIPADMTGSWMMNTYASLDPTGHVTMESKEWEHSEPGTGSPPLPRTDEDGSDDPAITGGWRRSPLPVAPFEPGAPTPQGTPVNTNKSANPVDPIMRGEEELLTGEEYARLCAMVGIAPESTPEQFAATVQNQLSELTSFKDAVSMSSEEERLKKEFPQLWAEHQRMIDEGRENKASAFVDSIKTVKRVTGSEGQLVNSEHGLSALAMDTLKLAHMKFSVGTGTLADFETSIRTITDGGLVKFGEQGSAIVPETPAAIDLNTPAGVSSARMQFAGKVNEIMKSDSVDMETAVKLAAEKYPDLAQGWKAASAA